MNIVGENFPRKIVEQINIRQQKKGAKNRNPGSDPSLLVWQNANTGWVKMVSSVNINLNERLKASNNEMTNVLLPESQLAQQYVLFGGISEQGKGKNGLHGGIDRDGSILSTSAYGLGGLDFGLRPMPGITSFSIKTENRGSLKTATIGIKCYNRQQFDIINTLYLSLGYSVLIEWGNTMYYDNNEKFIKENPYSLADDFLTGNLKWNDISDKIRDKRLESCGNYDASLGKIVNFRWTVNRDLSYDITVTVRSIGDVIESLKMNALSGYISVSLSEQQALIKSGGEIKSTLDLPERLQAFQTIEKAAIAANSPDPKLTAAISMLESSWLTSNFYKQGYNAFGQTITKNQINTKGIVGELPGADNQPHAKYDSLESAVKHHLEKWSKYYVPENAEQSTKNLIQAGYNTVNPEWDNIINIIYNKRKNLAPPTQQTQSPSQPGVVDQYKTFIQNAQNASSGLPSISPPSSESSINIINQYAYTHDIGALFYNTRISLDSNPVFQNGENVDAVKIDFTSGGNLYPQYYIRLGYFLQQLEENIILQLKNSDKNNPSKIIKFDYDINSNIILLYGRQLSANPNVCIFQRKYILSDKQELILFPQLNNFLLEGSGSTYSSFYGKIMNSYFSMSYILEQIEANKSADTGVLTLIDLLTILTRGFNNSTGNYNKLTPTVDSETNIVKFIDDLILPDASAILKTFPTSSIETSNIPAEFKMFGYYATPDPNKSLAGIVRDLSLTTTVSPNLANMITIGAQANGYVTGQDSTALSVMNYGLVDRVKEEWIEPTNPNSSYPNPSNVQPFIAPLTPSGESNNFINTIAPGFNIASNIQTQVTQSAPTLESKYKDVIAQFNRFIQEMKDNIWNQDDINAFTNSIQSFAEYDQAKLTLNQRQTNASLSSPSIGFLPFDLTLIIDGLSGMKVYQKYIADTEFLPSNYPQSLEFLIKGITHEIKDNQWITTLESLAVPKNPFGVKDDFNIGARISGQSSITERAAGAVGTPRATGFSTGGGGTSRTIEGKTYKNGQMEGALRPINNQAKYKGAISSDGGRIRLYTKASLALDQLIMAAEQAGITVKINSGYRTYDDQVRVKSQFGRQAATPGRSNHGFGLAVDFATSGLSRIKPGDKLYNWLAAGNGAKYGFKRIASESWHWEYQI